MNQTTLPGVREKMTEIATKAVADGRIPADTAAGGAAGLVPSFSKGTRPLDDNGKTIEERTPPAFEAAHVDLPAATETSGAAPSSAVPAAEAPAASTPAAGTVEAPAAAVAGTAAAEVAAEAVAEKMANLTFHDPDLDLDIPITVPERYAETVKRGYGRRTDLDRTRTYLKEADPVLREFIETGTIRDLLPIIQYAKQNESFGRFVTDAFRRAQQGLPLVEQVRAQAALEHAVAATETTEPSFVDPFVDPRVATLEQQLGEINRRDQERERAQQQTETQQRQQQENQRRINDRLAFAHAELASSFPGTFNPTLGQRDTEFDRAYQYALQAGYFQTYQDPAAAVRFGWQGVQQLDAERAQALQSPAAAALAAVDTRLIDAAAREARSSASTVAGGSVATTTAPATPPKPSTKMPDGKLKPQDVYMSEVLAWERAYGRLKGA